jgi:hypothetical protein
MVHGAAVSLIHAHGATVERATIIIEVEREPT